MLIINLLNASVEVDGAAGVLEVVAGVVNVDAVVLVCLVALQLVSGVPKKTLFFSSSLQVNIYYIIYTIYILYIRQQIEMKLNAKNDFCLDFKDKKGSSCCKQI